MYYPPGSTQWRQHITRQMKKGLKLIKKKAAQKERLANKKSPESVYNDNIHSSIMSRIDVLTRFQNTYHTNASYMLPPLLDPTFKPDLFTEHNARWRDFYQTRIEEIAKAMFVNKYFYTKRPLNVQPLKRLRHMDFRLSKKCSRIKLADTCSDYISVR